MAGEDEVLIIINQKVEEPKKEKKKFDFEFKWFKKKEKPKEDKPVGEIYIPQEVVEE